MAPTTRKAVSELKKHREAWRKVQRSARPIMVFQVGKVGSTSVTAALQEHAPTDVFQVHRLLPDLVSSGKESRLKTHHYDGWALFNHVIVPRRHARIITMVRDPISRNLSAYFQNRESSHFPSGEDFVKEYNQSLVTGWFDLHFKPVTGIDVYKHPFDPEQGWATIDHDFWPVLILRNELEDEIKAERLAAFTGLPITSVPREFSGDNREYADMYGRFKREGTLPVDYVDNILATAYAQHFYSEAEREKIRARWIEP